MAKPGRISIHVAVPSPTTSADASTFSFLPAPRGPASRPVVWSILFILMGISAYLIYMEGGEKRRGALIIYGVQLAANFVWPILFFQMQAFLLSFIWLALLWLLVLIMIIAFYRIKPLAAYLQIPYLVWLTFAGYLNLAIYLLNR